MESYELFPGNCQGSERIIIPEVELVTERKLLYIVQRLDVIGSYPCKFKLLSVVRSIIVCSPYSGNEALADQFAALCLLHALILLIPDK